ncbi:serpin family protein [Candidatus Dependentiae bacterium]|nr:serpin family protein [Candidatus Dependentiae bacterium]
MKKVLFIFLVFTLALNLFAFGASEQSNSNAKFEELISGNSQFAIDMFLKITESKKVDENIFFSPFSISTALGMTYAGARGTTAQEMAKALHFTLSQKDLHPLISDLLAEINKGGDAYSLVTVNALWGQTGYPFNKEFKDLIKKYYDGGFKEVDFAGAIEKSRKIINDWVEKNTKHKIKDLLHKGDITPLTRLVLTNAIYFKGSWEEEFDKKLTSEEKFYTESKKSIKVDMMHKIAKFNYFEGKDFQTVELPYKGDKLSMMIILPTDRDGIKDLEKQFTLKNLNTWRNNLRKEKINLSIPKFTINTRYYMKEYFKKLGMKLAFTNGADLSGIEPQKELYIYKIIHQAFVEVNEEGTEAAAATAVVVNLKSVPRPIPKFTADHPFIFLIIYKPNNSILFLGEVVNPK